MGYLPLTSSRIPDIVEKSRSQYKLKKKLCEDLWLNWDITPLDQVLFGPAEQTNPFFTTYAYSTSKSPNPETLKKELEEEGESRETLIRMGIFAQQTILTLRHDSFSSTGPTARYCLRLSDSLAYNFFSRSQRNELSLSDFGEIPLDKQKVMEIVSDLRGFEKERWAQLLMIDLLDSADKNKTYYNFCVYFNQRSLQRLSGQVLGTKAIDEGCLERFPVEAIENLEKTFEGLRNSYLIEDQEAIFRFLIETPKGERFIRLAYENPEILKNLDKDARGLGESYYSFKELQEIAKSSLILNRPKLFVCKSLEYLLLLGGMTPFLMGDDGVPSKKIAKIVEFIQNRGIIPFYFTYCPDNYITSTPESLKEGEYLFNNECSINKFYEYLSKNHGK